MDAAQALQFLRALWESKDPETGWILIWQARGKRSHWFRTATEAAAFCEGRRTEDLYVGTCLSPEDYGAKNRCEAAVVSGAIGFWADLDVADPVREKKKEEGGKDKKKAKRYPPDRAAVLKILLTAGPPPTLIVDSGHGLQVWWLLKEIRLFSSAEEREAFRLAVEAWLRHLTRVFKIAGYDIDSVPDLARIMRVPGTTNLKGTPVPVTIMRGPDGRFQDLEVFKGICEEADQAGDEGRLPRERVERDREDLRKKVASLKFPSGNPIDLGRLEALREVESRFDKSWRRNRPDLKDQSASAYCLSLASYAKQAAWSDQDVIDLVWEWRKIQGENEKRPEWYVTFLLDPASKNVEVEIALESLEEGGERASMMDALSKVLGFKVSGFIQNFRENARYTLVVEEAIDGVCHLMEEISIGSSANLLQAGKVRSILLDRKGIVLPAMKNERWLKIVANLMKIVEVKNADVDRDGAILFEWIEAHIGSRGAIHGESKEDGWESALTVRRPFLHEDRLWVSAPALLWTAKTSDDGATRSRIQDLLRHVGFSYRVIGSRTYSVTRGYWWIDSESLKSHCESLWNMLFGAKEK